MVEIIFVEEREVFPPCSGHRRVPRDGSPAVLLVDDPKSRIGGGELVDKNPGAVLRLVVHENPLPVLESLCLHRGEGFPQESDALVDGGYY